jgi:hypothetical protein
MKYCLTGIYTVLHIYKNMYGFKMISFVRIESFTGYVVRTQLNEIAVLRIRESFTGYGTYPTKRNSCVADPGCLSRIPDPTFFHPGSASKHLSILTQKMVSKKPILDPGSKGQKCTGSRIRNTSK